MKARLGASWTKHLGLGALSVALVATPGLMATTAQAMPAAVPSAVCLGSAGTAVPAARRIPDTPDVSAATAERVEKRVAETSRELMATRSSGAAASAALPVYRVKVQIHVIQGSHKKERKLSRKGARHKVFRVLKRAYNGFESSLSEPMGIVFRLKKITITKNDRWYHATPMSRADRQMKRRLHRGTATTLNIYVNKPTFRGGGLLLGYSRFPWQYRHHKTLDGVTVNVRSLPGGSAFGYNLGDSVVHETGHWLGLFHTFQGGNGDPANPQCDLKNDGVADTPAEYRPNFTCSAPVGGYAAKWGTTVCDPADMTAHGFVDPAFNFMDYSLDACMRMFTLGQHVRVAGLYKSFRAGR